MAIVMVRLHNALLIVLVLFAPETDHVTMFFLLWYFKCIKGAISMQIANWITAFTGANPHYISDGMGLPHYTNPYGNEFSK